MKKNKKHIRQSLEPGGKEICETNIVTLVDICSDDPRTESCTSILNRLANICDNDISPQENSSIVKSYNKAINMDNSRIVQREFDLEQDIIQDMEHRVFDRLLISALGKIHKDCEIKDNNQYQCVNNEKIEEVTNYLASKFNEDHQIEISKPISKRPFLINLNEKSSKYRRHSVSISDTKLEKAKPKAKRRKNNIHIKIKNKLITTALNEGVVDNNVYYVDDHKVYDDNVASRDVYEQNINDTKEITNLLLANISPFVKSISYPRFIYDKDANDSGTDLRVKEDKKCTEKYDSVTDERQVETVRETEQGTSLLHLREYFFRHRFSDVTMSCGGSGWLFK